MRFFRLRFFRWPHSLLFGMLKPMTLLTVLHTQKNPILALARQYGAENVRVFGSVARGEETPESDIDFLVTFPRGYDLFTQRLPLVEALESLLHRKIDLIPEHELNRHIAADVLGEAVGL
jgi:predicted nucleotidyltransferase